VRQVAREPRPVEPASGTAAEPTKERPVETPADEAPEAAPSHDPYFWSEVHDHTLVIYCSDPRLREANVAFLTSLGLAHYDQMVVPGGPAVILQSSLTFTSDRPRLQMLVEEHQIHRIIALAHVDCAYYRKKYTSLSAEERQQKQQNDLRAFTPEVKKIAPGIEDVSLYYAAVEDGEIRFLPVS
jgi:hypothetical protein